MAARQIVDQDRLIEVQAAADLAMEAATLSAEKVAEVLAVPGDEDRKPDRPVRFGMRLRHSTVAEIHARAQKDGVSLKLVLCRALASYGLKVSPLDLEEARRGGGRRDD